MTLSVGLTDGAGTSRHVPRLSGYGPPQVKTTHRRRCCTAPGTNVNSMPTTVCIMGGQPIPTPGRKSQSIARSRCLETSPDPIFSSCPFHRHQCSDDVSSNSSPTADRPALFANSPIFCRLHEHAARLAQRSGSPVAMRATMTPVRSTATVHPRRLSFVLRRSPNAAWLSMFSHSELGDGHRHDIRL